MSVTNLVHIFYQLSGGIHIENKNLGIVLLGFEGCSFIYLLQMFTLQQKTITIYGKC